MAGLHIPDHILNNILARLLTKPLVRFKSISRHWNRLISDPDLIKSRSRQMILLPVSPLYAIDENLPVEDSMIKLRCPFGQPIGKEVTIVGTFNGVVLLVLKSCDVTHMILYNPFTGASKVVPDPPSRTYPLLQYAYGFGYGSSPDDLKIVRFKVFDPSWEFHERHKKTCDVFKSNSWSAPRDLIDDFYFCEYVGTFVKGFLHWIAHKYIAAIIALNVEEMVFSAIYFPSRCGYPSGPLGTLYGHLCMICPTDDSFNVWVMKEHGVEDSWSKICSFELCSGGDYLNRFYHICILGNGKILLMNNSGQLIIYDILKESYNKLNVSTNLGDLRWTSYGIEYVESLASPTSGCLV